ncbi:flavin reductase [Roseovarius spongiae]|uniref:Flavin reductase n=1 Tax=Roseovarius spongiae TaxID=2320272 RepID=A0A3A8B7B7_9RHOB|nr:flavin reductase family protein [Roseovarius spongiae]RKF12573.1 flavin reductase [Roseovarius spongiae]
MADCDRLEKTALTSALRDAFGAFATGVTVVTTLAQDGRPVGFTANSFTSVSLDPPLLLICIGKTSSNLATFRTAESFAVNILADGQDAIAGRFAAPLDDRFKDTAWTSGRQGAPLLPDVAAWFDCRVHEVIDAGDHVVLIGRIDAFERSTRTPMIYLQGQYLSPPRTGNAARNGGGAIRAGCILGAGERVLMQREGGGWGLPMSTPSTSLRAARANMEEQLAGLGLGVEWNVLYSLFDDPDDAGTWVFFHGRIEPSDTLPEDMRLFDLDALPLDQVAARPVRAMLRRYALECRAEAFGLYVDAARHIGHVARFAGAPTQWDATLNNGEKVQ